MSISFYKKESSADKLIMTKTTTNLNQVVAGKVTTFAELTVADPTRKIVNGHEAVQLWENGPFWATCNVGATTPEGYGDYFAWGETSSYYTDLNAAGTAIDWKSGKESGYAWQSYCGQSTFKEWSPAPFDATTKILTPAYDAAAVKWGDGWRMPTAAEFNGLQSNCNRSWIIQGGMSGYKFTSKTNSANYIFLPAAGYFIGEERNSDGSMGYYWSSSLGTSDSSLGQLLAFYLGNFYMPNTYRYHGLSVRPVCE